ncbi:hypothetical protein [Neisseria musculi]|uniref:hypothetical protein n=1 Tax=Neisseria musculi TaxID=1815583 RepID=UPI00164AEC7E|nr:hypothetical protein [Neisseria musculi]
MIRQVKESSFAGRIGRQQSRLCCVLAACLAAKPEQAHDSRLLSSDDGIALPDTACCACPPHYTLYWFGESAV